MLIAYDADLGHKVTTSYADPDTLVTYKQEDGTTEWNTDLVSGESTSELRRLKDFPKYHGDIQFVPYWGAFVYVVKKIVHLKVDTTYDTTEDANYMMN